MRLTLAVVLSVLQAAVCGAEPLSSAYSRADAAAAFARARLELRSAAETLLDGGDAGMLRERLGALRPTLAPDAQDVFEKADAFLSDVARKPEVSNDDSLAAAVSEELDSLSRAKDSEELRQRAADELRIREDHGGAFPEDIPLERWNKLDPIRRFLVKHRWSRPRSYEPVTIADLEAGRVNVQKGVEVEGVVVATDVSHVDFDYNFRIGDIVMEVTPEWRLFHRHMHMPLVGERVRVRGWTYYDGFHKVEDFLHKKLPHKRDESFEERESLWEIHPVQDVEVLPAAVVPGPPAEPMCEDFPPDQCPPR